MANVQISDEPLKVALVETDVFGIDDVARVTWKVTAQQIANFISGEFGTENILYAAPDGSDSTGDGSILQPFATINHTMAQITSATATSPFVLFASPGSYDETIALKPNVKIVGYAPELTYITTGNQLTVSAGWASTNAVGGLYGLTLSGSTHIAFNFGALAAGNSTIIVNNCIIEGASTYVGRALSTDKLIIQQSNIVNLNFQGGVLAVQNCHLEGTAYVITNPASGAPVIATFTNGSITSNAFSIASANGGSTDVKFNASPIYSPLSLTGASTTVQLDAVSYPTGALSTASGATYSLVTIANSVKANYTPTNYTPVDTTVNGHLRGINSAIGTNNLINNALFSGNFSQSLSTSPQAINAAVLSHQTAGGTWSTAGDFYGMVCGHAGSYWCVAQIPLLASGLGGGINYFYITVNNVKVSEVFPAGNTGTSLTSLNVTTVNVYGLLDLNLNDVVKIIGLEAGSLNPSSTYYDPTYSNGMSVSFIQRS